MKTIFNTKVNNLISRYSDQEKWHFRKFDSGNCKQLGEPDMSTRQESKRYHEDGEVLTSAKAAGRRPVWHELSHRFDDDRACLASYLALEAAEVIGGVKPANLINLVDRQRPCGHNLYQLWKRHGQQLLAQSGLAARELVQRNDGLLLLIYHQGRMMLHLDTPKVTNFLSLAGYSQPAAMEQVLAELEFRFKAGNIPHEVGVILGYPLKDVAGFMGWVHLPVTHQGPWKIYGDPQPSLAVVAACRGCRETMARRLHDGINPLECLRRSAQGVPFFANI